MISYSKASLKKPFPTCFASALPMLMIFLIWKKGFVFLDKELNREGLTVAKALKNSKKYDHARISRFLYFLSSFCILGTQRLIVNLTDRLIY